MSMGGGKGGGGADVPKWQERQAKQGWKMMKQRHQMQNDIVRQFLDPFGGEGPPEDTPYQNPFWRK